MIGLVNLVIYYVAVNRKLTERFIMQDLYSVKLSVFSANRSGTENDDLELGQCASEIFNQRPIQFNAA